MIQPAVYDPTTWKGFGDITVSAATSPNDKSAVAGWLEAEHFFGSFKPVDHSLMHIVCEDGAPVAVIQWAACAYHIKDRDAWIGWSPVQKAKRRNLVVNNARFLVLDSARRPNLASKVLAHSTRALAGHWREHFGYEPLLCEPSGARQPAARPPRSGERREAARSKPSLSNTASFKAFES